MELDRRARLRKEVEIRLAEKDARTSAVQQGVNDVTLDEKSSSLSRPDGIQDCNLSLFLSKRFSDVTFVVDDAEIPAHRLILAVRSSVFEAMLYGDFWETGSQRITIADMGITAFREMLRYMYTNNLNITDDIVIELLLAAHKYDLRHLEERCSQYMQQKMNETNVCSFLNVLYNLDAFKDITQILLAFMESRWSIDCKVDFTGMSIDGLKYLVDFLSLRKRARDFKYMHFEVDLFRRILAWAKVNCEENGLPADGANMRKALKGCEQLISFTSMSSDEFHCAIDFSPNFFTVEEIGSIFTKLRYKKIKLQSLDMVQSEAMSMPLNGFQCPTSMKPIPNGQVTAFSFGAPFVPNSSTSKQ
ncbi:BTB/POZ domain-containing protein 6-A [Pseudolycoriella hygida]|uniref:BTB/POZ domain-containing protein 6-A n=1 Tax=Pseudolycoriella hygida TaxID=35572 RepID=A0A9Q0ND17_9DIPT|nr:BTB/POZ domain-containing protein 6-A [Pseudolycoriella hygida]